MKKTYYKHIGLPIRDLFIAYEIDHDHRVVRIDLQDHFDSSLLLQFIRYTLETDECIRVIDNKSHSTEGPARIEGRFDIELTLAGQLYDARIVQLGSYASAQSAVPEFTISMHRRKPPGDRAGMAKVDFSRNVLLRLLSVLEPQLEKRRRS